MYKLIYRNFVLKILKNIIFNMCVS